MNIIPTRRLYLALFLITILLCILAFLLPGQNQLLRIICFWADFVIAAICLLDLSISPAKNLLFIQRQVAERFSIGRQNLVKIIIQNKSTHSLQCLIHDHSPNEIKSSGGNFELTLAAQEKQELSYYLTPLNKGLYKFGSVYVRIKTRLGFFQKQLSFPLPEQIKVYSDLKALSELYLHLGSSSALGDIQRKQKGQGTNFTGLTDYVIGKDVRKIDWKATARTQRPIIREYDREQEQRLLILVDAGRMMVSQLSGMSKFDHALNAALSLSLAAFSLNDQVGLGIFANEPLVYLPPRRGKSYLQKFLDASANINAQTIEPDYTQMLGYFTSRQKGRSLIVLLTDLNDIQGSHALLSALTSLGKKHLAFCVLLADERVRNIAHPTSSSSKPYAYQAVLERAVATDMLSQRQLALDILHKQGCLVLDTTPERLSSELIARYLEIKRKALL